MNGCFGRWRGTRRSGRCEEGRPGPGGSLRSQPQSAVDRSRLRLHLAPKTCHTTCFAKVWLRTFGTTAYGSRCSLARAVTQRRSDHAPRTSQPWPKMEHRPRGRESEERSPSEGGSRAVPLLAQRAASEGPRWTRAVWPNPATCPKKSTGPKGNRRWKRKPGHKVTLYAINREQSLTSNSHTPWSKK